jgi:hypothetical protein
MNSFFFIVKTQQLEIDDLIRQNNRLTVVPQDKEV